MEPPFFGGVNPGSEALRWLAIAEKLLTSRDLMGSKSFATRARESDPQLVSAYQILAVVDTLMASEKRINNQLDWYLILQLQPTHDSEAIATQYRRLAILLNPQKNQLPFADQAFRLVVEAWSVLSNVSKKRAYDAEVSLHSQPQVNPLVTLDLTGQSLFGQNNPPLQQQQQQPQAQEFQFQINNSNNNSSSNISGGPITQWFREEQRTGMFMSGSSSGQMQDVGNVGRSQNVSGAREEDGIGDVGGYAGNNVWVSRDDGRGGNPSGSVVIDDAGNNVSVTPSGNVPIDVVEVEDVGEDGGSEVLVSGDDDGLRGNENLDDVEGTFWTACPYCYHLFEYPKMYMDCTLRCDKCRRAFHGEELASPPPIVEGRDAYFCCWGYMPLAVSVRNVGSSEGGTSSWAPFSPMFTCPQKRVLKSYGGPRLFYDDDNYLDVSDPSEGSDDDWRASETKKKTKNVKGKSAPTSSSGQIRKKERIQKAKNDFGVSAETTERGSVVQGSASGAVNDSVAESGPKGPASNTRRQSGRVANGKLDLNVEFSNETEEQVSRTGPANGAGCGHEDNFEGTGFFEGLDEFLSSLPILTGVGDERVKAA